MTAAREAALDHRPVGVAFTPFETRSDLLVETARQAERLGFTSVSVAEAMGLAAPVLLAQLALSTVRVELSSAVLSVWSRTPATLALTASQLQHLSGGRFVLGLGASTPPLVEGFHGLDWKQPLERVGEVLTATRSLLEGERLPSAPPGARPLRMALPPPVAPPLGLAAITPPSVRLAGALADRWLPFLLTPRGLEDGREQLEQGARQAGRDGRASVTAYVPVALGPDEAAAAAVAARWLLTYCTRMGPVYPRVLRAHGYASELDALLEANSDPRHPVLPAAAERLAHDVLLLATYDQAPEVRRRWQSHADALSLVLPFGLPAEDLGEVLTALAPERAAAAPG